MKKTLLLAALSLWACATPPDTIVGGGRPPGFTLQGQPPAKRSAAYCHGNHCTVTVTVDAGCNVDARPYVLVMNHAYGAITVDWKLNAASGVNAQFTGGGVAFKTLSGQAVFQPQGNSGQMVTFGNNGNPGFYAYDVKVEANGQTCPILDPTGVNDM